MRSLPSLASAAIVASVLACSSFRDGRDLAASDGGASSSSGSPDASASASASDGGGEGGFCTLPANTGAACIDFEDGVVAPSGWTEFENNGATATIVESCGPRLSARCVELRGSHPMNGASGDYGAALRFSTSGPPRNVSIAMAVRLGAVTGGTTDLVGIVLTTPAKGELWVLEVEVDQAGAMTLAEHHFTGGGDDATYATAGSIQPERWERIDLGLTVSAVESSATLKINGAVVATKPLVAHTQASFDWVEIGDRQLDTGVSATVRFDEVTVR